MNSPSGTVAVPDTHIIESLAIQNYRCFENYTISDFGRVNLLVGMNNSGKTSILEAIQILATGGDIFTLASILQRRGEYLPTEPDPDGRTRREMDVRHLFHGYEFALGGSFRISTNFRSAASVTCTLTSRDEMQDLSNDGSQVSVAILNIKSTSKPLEFAVSLSGRGGLSKESIDRSRSPFFKVVPSNVQFISASSVTTEYISSNWQAIALTSEEDRVLDALRILDPEIERIAFIGGEGETSNGRGGVVVKRRGSNQRVAFGSMGDGMWRMLALSIALIRSKDGVLLVDDIDTGLHYTVMADMWKLIATTAKRLNIQVFATTHSGDCVDSLAEICRSDIRDGSEVSLHRIERKQAEAVAYTEREITIAATREIEVR